MALEHVKGPKRLSDLFFDHSTFSRHVLLQGMIAGMQSPLHMYIAWSMIGPTVLQSSSALQVPPP